MPSFSPDTHNIAVQASAYKLITILHDTYPFIGRLQSKESIANLAQASLLQYIDCKINPKLTMSTEEIVAIKNDLNISGTIRFIDYVTDLSEEDLSRLDKEKIFMQVKVIANTYPNGKWSVNQEHWSINQWFNKESRQFDKMMTSPAEALNLVCTAIFDRTCYRTEEGMWEQDLKLRMVTIYSHLLRLREQTLAGSYEKCAAGLQHDLIYFLNGSFLDKTRDKEGSPIDLLTDTESFVLDSLSTFVSECINSKKESELTQKMILDWIHWKDQNTSDENPMITWLKMIHPEPLIACKQFVISRCEDYGLSIRESFIDAYVDTLEDIPVIMSENTIFPIYAEIMRMQEIVIPKLDYKIFSPASAHHLIHCRNEVLAKFKAQISRENLLPFAATIKDFFSALESAHNIYHHRDLIISIAPANSRFLEARERLIYFLMKYFNHFTLDSILPQKEFELCRNAFDKSQKVFLGKNHSDLIVNCFLNAGNFHVSWHKLLKLKSHSERFHPVVMQDEIIKRWLQETRDPHGVTFSEIKPYAANRFLLHGLLLPTDEWSSLYCESLIYIIDWLLEPSFGNHGISAFKNAYSPYFLMNLKLIASLKILDLNKSIYYLSSFKIFEEPWKLNDLNLLYLLFNQDLFLFSAQQREKTFSLLKGQLIYLINNHHLIDCFFDLSPEKFNEAQRSQILCEFLQKPTKNKVPLSNLFHLSLFRLSLEQLNLQQREMIFNALGGEFILDDDNKLLDNDKLYCFFQLPIEKFTPQQRTRFLTLYQPQVSNLIQFNHQLCNLFDLSLEKLSEVQRELIVLGLNKRLEDIVIEWTSFIRLFYFPQKQLSNHLREYIFKIITKNFNYMINNFDVLDVIFNLHPEKLTLEQRDIILHEISHKLPSLINTPENLYQLLSLSPEYLSVEQKEFVLRLLGDKLPSLINTPENLYQLLSLSTEYLSVEQKEFVLRLLGDKLPFLINTPENLYQLLSLSPEYLSVEHKEFVLELIGDKLPSYVGTGNNLYRLFCLSPVCFPFRYRDLLLYRLVDNLAKLIPNNALLYAFFSLSHEQFNENQRSLILSTLSNRLIEIIHNGYDLYKFFLLSPRQVNVSQRSQILAALHGQLSIVIKNFSEFVALVTLPSEHLSHAQRNIILGIPKKGLFENAFRYLFTSSDERIEEIVEIPHSIASNNIMT